LKIELDAPNVGELEKKYLNQAVDQGFVSTFGPLISEFEKKIANYLVVDHAVAVQSGTAAIYMALYELGIGPGDEVIVPSLTFAATVNPVLYAGATPVIVDVDAVTWNIDPVKIKGAISKKTKAIIPVHLYGNPCDMDKIMAMAGEHGLYVIEDATESLGAKYDGKDTGTIGDFGCLSFNGNKLITTGGGGMVVGKDRDKIDHIRYLVNQSKDKGCPDFHSQMGFNFRMTNVEAALGLAQFERIEGFLGKKRNFREIYQQAFNNLAGVSFQEIRGKDRESSWFTCIQFAQDFDLVQFMQTLQKKGVPTRRVFRPLHEMPYLKEYSRGCADASKIYDRGLCLPSSTINEEKDIKEAAKIIKEAYGKI
jgi:perosamine synthetase